MGFKNVRIGRQIWNTRDDGSLDVQAVMEGDSLTEQQFKDDCDINVIMKRYGATGMLPRQATEGYYGEFSQLTGYQQAVELVQHADGLFDRLPAEVRSKFDNDPAKLVAWAEDPKNLDEAIALGLAPEKVKVPGGVAPAPNPSVAAPASVSAPPTPPAPVAAPSA